MNALRHVASLLRPLTTEYVSLKINAGFIDERGEGDQGELVGIGRRGAATVDVSLS